MKVSGSGVLLLMSTKSNGIGFCARWSGLKFWLIFFQVMSCCCHMSKGSDANLTELLKICLARSLFFFSKLLKWLNTFIVSDVICKRISFGVSYGEAVMPVALDKSEYWWFIWIEVKHVRECIQIFFDNDMLGFIIQSSSKFTIVKQDVLCLNN